MKGVFCCSDIHPQFTRHSLVKPFRSEFSHSRTGTLIISDVSTQVSFATQVGENLVEAWFLKSILWM